MKKNISGRERVESKHRGRITKNSANKEGNEPFHHFTSSGYCNIKRHVDQKAHRTMKPYLALVLI